MMQFWNNQIYPHLSTVLSTWTDSDMLMQSSKTHHSIWKMLFVLGADGYLERLEGKIKKC